MATMTSVQNFGQSPTPCYHPRAEDSKRATMSILWLCGFVRIMVIMKMKQGLHLNVEVLLWNSVVVKLAHQKSW